MTIQLTIDVNKLTKSRIQERTYTNKENQEVKVKEMKLALIPVKPENQRVIASGDGWELRKTYMVVEAQTKEERTNNVKTAIVGEGSEFVNTDGVSTGNGEDVPF